MPCWPRYLLALVVISLGAASLIGSCGRKGPLYLPEQSAQQAAPNQAEVPPTPASRPDPEPVRL